MKHNKLVLIALLSALTMLTSCEIESPKTTTYVPELELFNHCESNTFRTLEIMDNAIGLSLYLSAPDSMKNITQLRLLKDMAVIVKKKNNYYLVSCYKNSLSIDTLFSVRIDSSSIFTKGAKWKIRKYNNDYTRTAQNDTITITCLDSTKWSFKTNQTKLSRYLCSGELIISSSSKKPLYFSKVSVTGSNLLTEVDTFRNYSYKVAYEIQSALVKDSLKWKFKDGGFLSHWEDLIKKKDLSIEATYSAPYKKIKNGANEIEVQNFDNQIRYFTPSNN
jgi:ABC-type uncharacterized transport system auxiliary subunit